MQQTANLIFPMYASELRNTVQNDVEIKPTLSHNHQDLSHLMASASAHAQNMPISFTPEENQCRLHITNLPFKFNDEHVRSMFAPYGTVNDVEVIFNNRGSKGFGFVTMKTQAEAELAKNALDGKAFCGRQISVNFANVRKLMKKAIVPLIQPQTPNISNIPDSTTNSLLNDPAHADLLEQCFAKVLFEHEAKKAINQQASAFQTFLPTMGTQPILTVQPPVYSLHFPGFPPMSFPYTEQQFIQPPMNFGASIQGAPFSPF